MTILNTDLKLFEAEKMTDAEDGGGKITGNVIVSGQENNMFPDISRLDRAYGNIRLRQSFVAVHSQNIDLYAGAHVILTEAPADPAVSVTLFTLRNWAALRSQMRDYVERYLALGAKWNGTLQEKQLTGQRALLVWQRTAQALPDIGSVWALVQNEGLQTEFSQYVRITRVGEQLVIYFDNTGEYTVRQLTVEISDPLLHTFDGAAPSRYDGSSPAAVIRQTIAADAARYYGIQPLAEAGSIGDMQVQAATLYQSLVPSAQNEVAAVDLSASGEQTALAIAGGTATFTTSATIGPGIGLHLGSACYPGTLAIAVTGGTITDDGSELKLGGAIIGTLDTSNGLLDFNSHCPTFTGSKTVSFRPAGVFSQVADSAAIHISPTNRGYVYTINLLPIPAPGTLFIDYLALGKWYRLRDAGNGSCTGQNSAYGSAQISFVTGSVTLTTGALPDNGSEIIFSWGTAVTTFNRVLLPVAAPTVVIQLAHSGIVPHIYTVTWPGGNRIDDDGSGLLLFSSTIVGVINYTTGLAAFRPPTLPPGGTVFTSSYQHGDPLTHAFVAPVRDGNGDLLLQLPDTLLTPGSIEVEWPVTVNTGTAVVTVQDDGSGVFPLVAKGGSADGSVNYVTGLITIKPDLWIQQPFVTNARVMVGVADAPPLPVARFLFQGYQYSSAAALFPVNGTVAVRYRAADTPQVVSGETYAVSNLTLDLTGGYQETIVPASTRFRLGNRDYFERTDGLYHSLDVATGAATKGGDINRQTGVATLTDWPSGQANSLILTALLTQLNGQQVDEVTFRTPGAPLRPGSLSLRANQIDGTLVSATAGNDGAILTSAMAGTVDVLTGVARVRFGQWVTAAGHEAENWYWADAIRADGKIFRPAPVDPASITYNCVIYTYLPLSAAILGLDPVRLPIDGRVPVFQAGDIVTIHQTSVTVCPSPVSAGQVVSCGRVRIGRVELRDSLDAVVDPALYMAALDAGTVTFATPLNLTAYTQPLSIRHAIEDMALATAVDIDGVITLNRPLSHEFPAPGSWVSSALLIGDLYAHVGIPFSQQSWTNVWADSRIGNEIIPQYNSAQYPIAVENASCVQQRWALIFTSTTAFRVVGDTLGQVQTTTINEDCDPVNPNTGRPYFTLRALGWGGGWSSGNVLRFNTLAANFPINVARTILQSADSSESDRFALAIRGDIDRV